jgi:hypothetical protein
MPPSPGLVCRRLGGGRPARGRLVTPAPPAKNPVSWGSHHSPCGVPWPKLAFGELRWRRLHSPLLWRGGLRFLLHRPRPVLFRLAWLRLLPLGWRGSARPLPSVGWDVRLVLVDRLFGGTQILSLRSPRGTGARSALRLALVRTPLRDFLFVVPILLPHFLLLSFNSLLGAKRLELCRPFLFQTLLASSFGLCLAPPLPPFPGPLPLVGLSSCLPALWGFRVWVGPVVRRGRPAVPLLRVRFMVPSSLLRSRVRPAVVRDGPSAASL